MKFQSKSKLWIFKRSGSVSKSLVQPGKRRWRNTKMPLALMAHQCTGLRCEPLFSISSRLSKPLDRSHMQNKAARSFPVLAALISSPIPTPQTTERFKLKQTFIDAADRCRNSPMEGVSFTLQHFLASLEKYDFDPQLGAKVFSASILLWFSGFYFLLDCARIGVLIFSWFVSSVV